MPELASSGGSGVQLVRGRREEFEQVVWLRLSPIFAGSARLHLLDCVSVVEVLAEISVALHLRSSQCAGVYDAGG